MSSNRGSSQASRDSSNSMQDRDPGANQGRFDSQEKKIAKQVKKDIGLTATRGGFIAANAPDPLMYGKAASEAAKKRMEERGLGTYNPETGSFSNVVGNRIISGNKMYGDSGTAMGSGDPTGVMTSIPISQKMFERQKNIVSAIGLGLGLAGVPIIPSAMIFDAQRKSYDDYIKRFNNIQTSSTVLARNVASNNQVDASNNNRSAAVADQSAMSGDDEARIRNRSAYSGLTGAEQDARTFLDATGRRITGSMN